jgi:hypothetical protein
MAAGRIPALNAGSQIQQGIGFDQNCNTAAILYGGAVFPYLVTFAQPIREQNI